MVKRYLNRWLRDINQPKAFLFYKTEQEGYQRWTYLPDLKSNYKLFPSSFLEDELGFMKMNPFRKSIRKASKKEIKDYKLKTIYAKLLLMRENA